MKLVAVGQTDVGQKRDHNEDAFLVDDALGLYVVCDGMGGHAAGEIASAHAIQTVRRVVQENARALEQLKAEDLPENRERVQRLVERAVQSACGEIYRMATEDTGKAGMGTTLVMMLMVGQKGIMGHVGDSRVYLNRQDQLHQLSEDHSYVAEMIKRGRMTEEEAKTSPYANVITRAVGIQESVEVDTLLMDILPGDTILLCSDGLHGYTSDKKELSTMLAVDNVNSIPPGLIHVANSRGGKDNITAIVIRAMTDGQNSAAEHARAEEVNLKLDILKKIPIFRYLTYQELVRVLNSTYVSPYQQGDVIIREGDNGEELFIVLSGTVKISSRGEHLAELGAGGHFGEMALVDHSPRSATVEATTHARMLVMQRTGFYTLIRKEPALAVKLLWSFVQGLSRRLRDTNNQLSGLMAQRETLEPFFIPGDDEE